VAIVFGLVMRRLMSRPVKYAQSTVGLLLRSGVEPDSGELD